MPLPEDVEQRDGEGEHAADHAEVTEDVYSALSGLMLTL